MKLTITWAQAQQAEACSDGVDRVLAIVGRKRSSLRPNSHIEIARIENLDDAIWALALVRPDLARLFAADCAERALIREVEAGRHIDPRSWAAVNIARAFAIGSATVMDLDASTSIYADDVASSTSASYAAFHSVSSYASHAASYAAFHSVSSYAVDAAFYASRAASYTSRAAADERRWQLARLRQYCTGAAPACGIME